MREDKAMGIILPGEGNPMMGVLSDRRTMGSIPFGGRYRLVDFSISCMVNAGITDVGIVTRDNYASLMSHLGSGRDYDLARKGGGLSLLPPIVSASGSEAYRGELESLMAHRRFLRETPARYVILSTADLVGNFDLETVIERHIAAGADLTALYQKVSEKDVLGGNEVTFQLDHTGRIVDVAVGAPWHGPCSRYLGILVIGKDTLLSCIDELASHSRLTISRDLLQGCFAGMNMRGEELDGIYVKIKNLEDYYHASMSLLDASVRRAIFNPESPILTRIRDEVPTRYGAGAAVKNSLLADGCVIEGTVEQSVIFRSVRIRRGAVVKNCILMQDTEVAENAELSYVIADRNCYINEGRILAGFSSYPVVIGKESVV